MIGSYISLFIILVCSEEDIALMMFIVYPYDG